MLQDHFGFYQILRLAEQQRLSTELRAATDQAFPEFDLKILEQSVTHIVLQQNLFGLIGKNGMLPDHYFEYLSEKIHCKDFVLQNFLDIFNNAFAQYFHAAWSKAEFFVAYEASNKSDFTIDLLFSLMGILRHHIPENLRDVLLYHAGIMATAVRSKQGLIILLRNYFLVPIQIQENIGRWLAISLQEQTELSTAKLGVDAVIGAHFWDAKSSINIIIGPLTYVDFLAWLPKKLALQAMQQLIILYCPMELQFSIKLAVDYQTLPFCQLHCSNEQAFQLGWNTWLKTPSRPSEDVIIEFK